MRRITHHRKIPFKYIVMFFESILVIGLVIGLVILNTQTNNVSNVGGIAKQESVEAKRIVSFCKDDTYYQNCYEKRFALLGKLYPIQFVADVLRNVWNLDQKTLSCHTISHRIGLSEVEKNPSDWKKLLQDSDPQFCSGGLFHGILEGHAQSDPAFSLEKSSLESLCLDPKNLYYQGSCAHILGHILLVEKNGVVADSVQSCGKLSAGLSDQCYSGVFMENMVRTNLIDHGIGERIPWNQDTTVKFGQLCLDYSGKAANGCWGEMGHLYSAVNNDNSKTVFNLCNSAPDASFAENCYLHAASKMGVTLHDNAMASQVCDVYSPENKPRVSCITQVLSVMITTSPQFFSRASLLCSHQPDALQESCFRQLGQKLGEKVSIDTRDKWCATLEAKFRASCSYEAKS